MSLIINYTFNNIFIEILQNQNNYSLTFTINELSVTNNFDKYNKAYDIYNNISFKFHRSSSYNIDR
jgi:hypothetical protein